MDEEILKWIADYCNGVLEERDYFRLQAWLQKDAGNRAFFDRHVALHQEVRTLYFLEQSDPEKAWQKMEGTEKDTIFQICSSDGTKNGSPSSFNWIWRILFFYYADSLNKSLIDLDISSKRLQID